MKTIVALFCFAALLCAMPAPFAAQPLYSVELLKTRLEPYKLANGGQGQMVYADWRNNGKFPVGLVKAKMVFYGTDGSILDVVESYTIFAALSEARTIKPTQTYREPHGEGFVVMPKGPRYEKAARAEVTILQVGGMPSY